MTCVIFNNRHGRAAHALVLQSFMTATIESFLRGHALSVLYLHGVKYVNFTCRRISSLDELPTICFIYFVIFTIMFFIIVTSAIIFIFSIFMIINFITLLLFSHLQIFFRADVGIRAYGYLHQCRHITGCFMINHFDFLILRIFEIFDFPSNVPKTSRGIKKKF